MPRLADLIAGEEPVADLYQPRHRGLLSGMRLRALLLSAVLVGSLAACGGAPKPDDCVPVSGSLADMYSTAGQPGFDEAATLHRDGYTLIGGRAEGKVAAWALSADGDILALDWQAHVMSGLAVSDQISKDVVQQIEACVA